MKLWSLALLAGVSIAAWAGAMVPGHAFAVKDQARMPGMDAGEAAGSGTEGLGRLGPLMPAPGEDETQMPPGNQPGGEDGGPVVSTEVIGTVEQVELNEDLARRALDAFILLKSKYQDTDIAEYETLEQFVAEAKQGKALEADIKQAGFATVTEWNNTIMSVSFAYAAVAGSQDQEIRAEIESIRSDDGLDPALKKSLVESLESMLPSDHNKQVVSKLNAQPEWAKKLETLAEDENEEGIEH
jgi:hypothetical protein